jgi:hypothetical protein
VITRTANSARSARVVVAVQRALLVALFVVLAACSRKPPQATPEGAVRELVERMRRLQGDPADAKAVFELLSSKARSNLAARAQRYGAASGKTIAPEAMLVASRFVVRFEPQRFASRTAGAYALVEVTGASAAERAAIPCLFEEGVWRVDLALPPLPPVQKRPGLENE